MWEPKIQSSGNPAPSSSPAAQQQSQEPHSKLSSVEDSGQIDSGFLSSEHILQSFTEYEEDKEEPAPVAPPKSSSSSSSAPKDPKTSELEPTYLDSGLVEDAEFDSQSGMLLERELDHGLAEWLCTLDMKNNSTAAANSINNLSRRVDLTTASLDQMNISDAPKKMQKRPQQKEDELLEMPEEEQPWEVCYKQDAEGDT